MDIISETTSVSIGLTVAVIVAIVAFQRWIVSTRDRDKIRTDQKLGEMYERLNRLRDEFTQFQITVARHYASDDRLRETTTELKTAINSLVDRFDAFASDFHRLIGRFAPREPPDPH